jgi:hypothetical protein
MTHASDGKEFANVVALGRRFVGVTFPALMRGGLLTPGGHLEEGRSTMLKESSVARR